MIKLITSKSHRFNRHILIKDKNVFVDGKGEVEVEEGYVTSALAAGFELVDKDAKFTSVEEEKKVKDVNDLLTAAKEQAKEIINQAKIEADRIILEAKNYANVVIQESGIEEKEEFIKTLSDRKVDELREIVASSDFYTKEQYSGMKKAELIEAIVKIRYPEE